MSSSSSPDQSTPVRAQPAGSHIPGAATPSSRPVPQGRVPTGHASATASAALQDFARGRPSSKRSSTASSVSVASFQSVREEITDRPTTNPRAPPPPRHGRPTFAISPPSTSASPSSSPSSSAHSLPRSSNNPFEDGIAGGKRDNDSSKAPAPVRPGPETLRPLPPRPRGRPQMRRQPSSASQPPSPMALSDLGRDYSRYPFPSPRRTGSTPSTPAPQYSSGSVPLLGSPLKEETKNVTQLGLVVDPEKGAIFLLDDRLAATSFAGDAGGVFPMYVDEKEVDDDMHNPEPGEEEALRPHLRHLLAPRQLLSMAGLLLLILGLLCVFILLPVLSYTGHAIYDYPYRSPPGYNYYHPSEPWAYVNDVQYPLLKNIRTGLIDPHTPIAARTKQSVSGEELQLVFSDEFTVPNRTFYPGDDPYWTAQVVWYHYDFVKPDIWYGATQDLEWYDPDAATTQGGTLALRLDNFVNHDVAYRSGMLNSWNQMCFKGGALEVSVSLPGPGGASGLWPGIWTMGNLGRPGYKASTEGLWPYTYNSCDVGITANQSMDDGTSYLVGQRLPSCTCAGEDHPTPGTGRGAPEIDVFEASADPNLHLGLVTQSYQVAPYDIWYQPNYDFLSIPDINRTQMNGYCGGPFQQAISAQTELNNAWYDGENYQTYGFEYTPGSLSDGQITWFVGPDVSFSMTGDAVGPNGNVAARPISEEPMSIVLNVGFSKAWTGIVMGELRFPTTMYVDYVRVYQPVGEESITCDPPGYETTEYIKNHPEAYFNPNLTLWSDTSYSWPKNKLNGGC